MDHILSGHKSGGSRTGGSKDLFPDYMTDPQIKRSVKEAYKNCKKIKTQGDRVKVRGSDKDGNIIEMWINTKTKIIETAYPY